MSWAINYTKDVSYNTQTYCGYLFFAIIFLFLPYGLLGDEIKDTKRLQGKVIRQEDSTAIESAHVINLTRSTGTSSKDDGSFAINMMAGDSIMFQAIGFKNDTILVTEEFFKETNYVKVKLRKKTYLLPGVDIFPYATYAEFKQAFIHFDDNKLKDSVFDITLDLPQMLFIPPTSEGAVVTVTGPITFLYDQFSREGREKRKYNEIIEHKEIETHISRLVNPNVVIRLTDLEDEEEINDFLDFCNLSYEFIVNSKEYQVYEALLSCYRRYKLSKP